MRKSKFLYLPFMALLCACLLVSCNRSSNQTAEVSSGDDTSPITLEFYSADGRVLDWDNPVAKAITDATGVTLDISYPLSNDEVEDVGLMIANDDYPDLIFAKESATSLYAAGAYIDMSDLIDQYGPNIKKMYGDEYDKLRWGEGDDGIYQLSYAGVRAETLSTGGTCQIQWAAIKENDYVYPTTLAEFEALIKKYMAAHPKTEDGLDTIGLSISASDWHWMIDFGNPAGYIGDAAPDNGQWLVDDQYNVTYKHVSPDEKTYFQWLNRMYNEGVLDGDFATQTDDDYIAKLATGRVVALTDAWWHYLQPEQILIRDGKVDKTYCGLPVVLDDTKKCATLFYQGLAVGEGIGITKGCKDPVRAVKFLDFLCSDEGQILYHWGIEGVHYFLDENGKRYRTPEEIERARSDPNYNVKTGMNNYNGFPTYGDGALAADGQPYTTNTRESIIAEYNEEQRAACERWGVEMLIDIFPQPDEFELLPYSALWSYPLPTELSNMVNRLDEIAWPGLITCVIGSEADFESNWNEMVSELEDVGMEEANQRMTEFLARKIVR